LNTSQTILEALTNEAFAVAKERLREHKAQATTVVPRKLARYQADPAGFGREVLGEYFTDDVVRVMESVRDYPITVARSGNGTGKTHGAARIATWFYLCFPGAKVYTTAAPPEQNLRNLLWGVTDMRISRSPNEFITGILVPSSGSPDERQARFSGKHAPYLLFIVDEGDAVPEAVYKGIESCMSGGMARLLIMFNPRSRTGPVYLKERRGEANVVELSAFTHPNVVTGEDKISGAVDRPTTVRRINEWTRPLMPDETPDGQCFEVPEYLVGVVGADRLGNPYPPLPAGWRKITDSSFSHMVLARYPAAAPTQLISEEWIDAAELRYRAYVAQYGELPPANVRPIMGVDVGEYGHDDSSLCRRYGTWVAPFITWNGVDVLITGDKVAEYFVLYNGLRANVDSTGVGAGVAPQVMRALKARHYPYRRGDINRIMVAAKPTKEVEHGQFAQLRDQLWWEVREWLKGDPGAMLPPDENLRDELLAPTYERDRRGNIKVTDKETLRTRLGRSPNKADSLAMTFAPAGNTLKVAMA